MADTKISGLAAAGTLNGAELAVCVKSGVTSQTTTQDIADLAAGSNLGSADLTSTANARIFTLNGSLSTNTLTFEAGSGVDIQKIQGDGDVLFYDSAAANYIQFDQSQQKIKVAQHEVGNNGTAAQYAFKAYGKLSSTSGIAGFYNSSSGLVVDFRQISGNGTLGIKDSSNVANVFFHGGNGTCEVSSNYIVNGTAGIGAAAGTTYTFGGGGSGDIASMTFEGGILTAVTTVP